MTGALALEAGPLMAGLAPAISDAEFARLRDWLEATTGIHLTTAKRMLVTSRLARRLRERQCASFGAYLRLVEHDAAERQLAVDLLTTNETYFFREPKHFDFLQRLLPQLDSPVRIWSAACSSGEEAYSIAMLLDSQLRGRPWEVLGTDISTRVLEQARAGLYRMQRTNGIPPALLSRYCMKGTGRHEGTLLVRSQLRERLRFEHMNLREPAAGLGRFDVIFLRNVMIYFDLPTKRAVVDRLLAHLRPGGHLLVGHSESLGDVTRAVRMIAPAIYRAPG